MSQITIDSAGYTTDYTKSPKYIPLGKKEVAKLQANEPFSIVGQITTIAEKCLGIKDYTKFEFTARKDQFVFRKMDEEGQNAEATYTLTLAGGQWTCVTDAGGPAPVFDAENQNDITRAVTRLIANVLGARKGVSDADGGKASAQARGRKRKHKKQPSSDLDSARGATPPSSPPLSSRRRRSSSDSQGAAFRAIETRMEELEQACAEHDESIDAAQRAQQQRQTHRSAEDILAAAQAELDAAQSDDD